MKETKEIKAAILAFAVENNANCSLNELTDAINQKWGLNINKAAICQRISKYRQRDMFETKPVVIKRRTCLQCGKKFNSQSAANRICGSCRKYDRFSAIYSINESFF